MSAGRHSARTLPAGAELRCEVAVVGSGAGGATLAAELAEAGIDVLLLEEGSYHGTEEFSTDTSAMIRRLYRDGGGTAAIGEPPVLYQEGCTVGGSTVINGGMSFRAPEAILAGWARDHGIAAIGPEVMEFYFERVERRLHVGPQGAESIGRDNQILREAAERRGWEVIVNQRAQLHCAGSNNCAFGCPTGAKQSALVSYIPRALHFGARLLADLRAERLLCTGKRITGVAARVIGPDRRPGAPVQVRAQLVVVACGAIQTPVLLMRSGIRSPSGQLGKNLSIHPNSKVVAIFDDPVRGWEGVHQAYQVREFHREGLLFAAVNVPPAILAMTLPRYGGALGELMEAYPRMVIAGVLVEDESRGRVLAGPLGPVVTYQLGQRDAERLVRGSLLLAELLMAAGARRVLLPLAGLPELRSPDDLVRLAALPVRRAALEVLTVHLMGTARMGADRGRAVTDAFGLVHDAERLAICDASLFPGPIGVNPAETIQALATRTAHHLIEHRHRYLS